MIMFQPIEDDPPIAVPITFKGTDGIATRVKSIEAAQSMPNGFFGNLQPAKPVKAPPKATKEVESELEKEEAEEERKKQAKIARTKPFKTKQCPHCATFNLIKDPDSDYYLLCKKCGWNDFDPYKKD